MMNENKENKEYKEKRYVWILLSRYYDRFANILYSITGHGYTHASIGVGEESDSFYSFNFNGFCTEDPRRRLRISKNIPAVLFQLEVTEREYEDIRNRIEHMKNEQKKYHYSKIGVLLCLLHIPHCIRHHYFCSQFVADLLIHSGAIQKQKSPSLFLPNTFLNELKRHPKLRNVVYNPMYA